MNKTPFVVDIRNYTNITQKRTQLVRVTALVGLLASAALILFSVGIIGVFLSRLTVASLSVAFASLLAAVFIWTDSRSKLQLKSLLENGQWINGAITQSKGYYRKAKSQRLSFSKGNWWIEISCEFETPARSTIKSTAKILRNDMKGQTPKVGTPVQILYLDEQHFKVI